MAEVVCTCLGKGCTALQYLCYYTGILLLQTKVAGTCRQCSICLQAPAAGGHALHAMQHLLPWSCLLAQAHLCHHHPGHPHGPRSLQAHGHR
jgi:hypothetical protein